MNRMIALIALTVATSVSVADDAVRQIEEVVVTGAVRANENIEIAAIDLPGDAELMELPVINQ
ncbi:MULTISPECIES: hypothetical protein [Gammaproteobacteria]|uniref:hypothetical protein n=1 Tax=Gammaproteobacteria TaxID=1236 RepID=UPI0035668056